MGLKLFTEDANTEVRCQGSEVNKVLIAVLGCLKATGEDLSRYPKGDLRYGVFVNGLRMHDSTARWSHDP